MNQYIGYYVYLCDNIKNSRDIEANITLSRHGGLAGRAYRGELQPTNSFWMSYILRSDGAD